MNRLLILSTFSVILLALLSACAAGPNPQANTPNEAGETAGFWQGLWHGVITPVTFLISLFNDNINIYEVANNGNWYNFGYVMGVSIIFGGGGGGASARRRSRRHGN